eukprot:s2639_g13.t1
MPAASPPCDPMRCAACSNLVRCLSNCLCQVSLRKRHSLLFAERATHKKLGNLVAARGANQDREGVRTRRCSQPPNVATQPLGYWAELHAQLYGVETASIGFRRCCDLESRIDI